MSQYLELDIRQWLIALSMRCAVRTVENLELITKDYATGLIDLPYEAFTPQSREAAARKWDNFPSYKALRKFLEDWVDTHKPTLLLPPIEDPNLTDQDKAHVRSWINLRSQRNTPEKFATGLSVLRKWPAAFAHVCRTDADAASVARERGWIPGDDPSPLNVSEAGIARTLIELEQVASEGLLGAAVASARLAMLRSAVQERAPDRLKLLPDAIKPRVGERSRSVAQQLDGLGYASGVDAARDEVARATAAHIAKHGRPPGALSREQLSEARKGANVPDLQPTPQPFSEPAPPAEPLFADDPPAMEEPDPSPPSADAKPIEGLPWFLIEGAEAA